MEQRRAGVSGDKGGHPTDPVHHSVKLQFAVNEKPTHFDIPWLCFWVGLCLPTVSPAPIDSELPKQGEGVLILGPSGFELTLLLPVPWGIKSDHLHPHLSRES